MIELLVIIWVVKLFKSTAFDKGYNKTAWAFIGALSYYIPVLLFMFLVAPSLAEYFYTNEIITSETGLRVILVAIDIAVGAICCAIAYQYLKRMPDRQPENPEIIDQQL